MKQLNQGFLMNRLKSYGNYYDVVNQYGILVSKIATDMLHL
jgi:hypothetical protein